MDRSHFVPKTKAVNRDSFIVDYCRGKSVLHVGMGGFIDDKAITLDHASRPVEQSLQGQLAGVVRSIVGLDINEPMVEHMRKAVPNAEYVVGNVCAEQIPELKGRTFEVVVFSDVIEHLDNFSRALQNLKALLAPDGRLLISTANAFSIDAFAKMLFRYESTHAEHTCYFSWLTLSRLFAMNGLSMEQFLFYTQDHVTYESLAHRITYPITRALSRVFPQYAMGVIGICRPAA